MEEKPKGDPYTMAFIERKGGIEEVARKTLMNRQTVRQVANGRNAPSYEFIMNMMSTYPTYDIRASVRKPQLNLVAEGDEDYESHQTDYTLTEETISPSPSLQVLATENAGLRNEIAALKNTVRILENVVSTQLGKSMEGSKMESSNESTQNGQLRLNLAFEGLREKRFIPISVRDAFGITPQWSNRRS